MSRIAILLLLHLLYSGIYLYLDGMVTYSGEWHGLKVDQWFSLGYFLPEALFTSAFILSRRYKGRWLDEQFLYVEVGFILLRGIIYGLHDSEVYTSYAWQRALWMTTYLFIVSFIIIFNAWKHGHFKD